MKREEFERLKEEEKKHLREIRDLKQKLREAQRMRRIGRALGDIQRAGELEGFDSSLEEVQRRAAEAEARLEIATEGAAAVDPIELPEVDEDALKKARAADFIQRMKVSMSDVEPPPTSEPQTKSDTKPKEKAEKSTEDPPADFDKTIGRMSPRGQGS